METYWVWEYGLFEKNPKRQDSLNPETTLEVVKAADAQATIAALQARVQELEGWQNGVVKAFKEAPLEWSPHLAPHNIPDVLPQIFKNMHDYATQLTQRTAQLTQLDRTLADVYAQRDGLQKDLAQRTAELEAAKAQLKTVTENAIAIFSHNTCDAHNQEINKESFATFLEKEKVRGCIRCMQAELERVRGELADERTAYKALSEQYNRLDTEQHRQGMEGCP